MIAHELLNRADVFRRIQNSLTEGEFFGIERDGLTNADANLWVKLSGEIIHTVLCNAGDSVFATGINHHACLFVHLSPS
jgi:hypothetical protein